MMNTSRRRGLMCMGGEPGLLFRRKNIEMQTGECLDTGIEILQAGLSVTVLLDYTSTNNPTSSSAKGSIYKLLQMGTTREVCVGKYDRANSELMYWWMPSSNKDYTTMTGVTASAGRKRIAVTHAANSNGITIYAKMGDDTLYTFTCTKTFSATNAKLSVAYLAEETSTAGVPNGTLNEISVYSRILSAEEIAAFFE